MISRMAIDEHPVNMCEPFEVVTHEGAQILAIQRRRFQFVMQVLVDKGRPQERRRYEVRRLSPSGDDAGTVANSAPYRLVALPMDDKVAERATDR